MKGPKKLKEALSRHGAQVECAKAIGTTQQAINALTTGRQGPSLRTAVLLWAYTGGAVSPQDWIDAEDWKGLAVNAHLRGRRPRKKRMAIGHLLFGKWLGRNGRDWRYRIASALGVEPHEITDWKRGNSAPDADTAARIERMTLGAIPALSWHTTEAE
jgi:plasmid maintenance system antidote protein VapI